MRAIHCCFAVMVAIGGTTAGTAQDALADGGDGGDKEPKLLAFRWPRSGRSGSLHWTWWWYANRPEVLPIDWRARPDHHRTTRLESARQRARDALLRALESDDALISSEAALALGRLGDPRDIPTLAKIVADPDDTMGTYLIHRYAALGLGLLPLGDQEQARTARRALLGVLDAARGDKRMVFWMFCAHALAMRGDASVLPDLVEIRRRGLEGPRGRTSLQSDVLGSICYALGSLGGELSLPEVEEHLWKVKEPVSGSKETAWEACHALGRIGGPRAAAVLCRAAVDERLQVRLHALHALGEVAVSSDDASAGVLRNALANDKYPVCRGMAAISLGRIAHPSSTPTLLSSLGSSDPEVQSYVAFGLALGARKTPDPVVADALLRKLDEDASNHQEKGAMALACGIAGVTAARRRIADLAAQSGIDIVVEPCAFALGMLGGGPEERSALNGVIARWQTDVEVLVAATTALGLLRDEGVIDTLRSMISGTKSRPQVRASGILCLGLVGDERDVDFLLALLDEASTSDRLKAQTVQALGLLLDRTGSAALGRVAANNMWDDGIDGGVYEPVRYLNFLIY